MTGQLNYNHLIYFPGDYYHYVFGDADSRDFAAYLERPKASFADRAVNRIQCSGRIPRRLRPGLFRLLYRKMIRRFRLASKNLKDPGKPLCFIMDRRAILLLAHGMYEGLKKEFPGAKIILLYTDLIGKDLYYEKMVLRNKERKFTDLICTYDPVEAEKYGIAFHNLPCMDFSGRFAGETEETDIFFIGKAKERYGEFLKVWKSLTGRGFSFTSYLFDVPEEYRKQAPEGIRFSDWIPYDEYLKTAAKSRIFLEIVQKGSAGNTLRVNEAVILGKKLISNNLNLKNNPVYDPESMFVFEDPDEIPEDFLRGESGRKRSELKRKLSLQVFLRDLEEMLSRTAAI